MSDVTSRPRTGRSATSLLLTVLGELVLPHGGEVWTSTLVDGLGLLGVGEANARQAAARLADDGLIESERVGRVARWHLTPAGRRLLEQGSDRIYGFAAGPSRWEGHWLVVLASIPEQERAKRHQLRTRLGFAGFGSLGPGIAVSPHPDREPDANEILRELGLAETAYVWVARTGSLVPDRQVIEQAWDLTDLAARYGAFVDAFEERRVGADDEAFAAVVELVHEWRRFPFDDPEIPDVLLPPAWPGERAKACFDDRRARWAPGANRWFTAAEDLGAAS
jgi:phenylacetic acid degradation operon negative regulatory protein